MKRKIGVIVGVILIILVLIFGILYLVDLERMANNEPVLFSTWGRKYNEPQKETVGIDIVLSLEDDITDDSAWCGTFNLIWNDLKTDLAKQDIVFENQTELVNNLNKGTFTKDNLSESSYYKTYGIPSLDLKKQIEKEIEQKFNEKSDILEKFDFEDASESDYFLYCMLKKEFEFQNEFTKFEDCSFENYNNVKCFGIDGKAEEGKRKILSNQVDVLYHDSNDSFAIKLYTKQNDEIIIAKGNKAKTFGKMYENILERAEEYKGPREIMIEENLKIPYISFNINEEITELEKQKFKFSNGNDYEISKAIQTIEFELNEKGGRIKSESGLMANLSAASPMLAYPRQFIVDDTFTIFLVENGKELPYFAAQISDISKVQEGSNTKGENKEKEINKVIFEQAVNEANEDIVTYIEITDEANQIEDMLYNLKFSENTCDGINAYNIILDNGKKYGLEIYDDTCHITVGGRGEAILSKEQSNLIKNIIEKNSAK